MTLAARALRTTLAKVELEAMIEAATIDCYNESEEITGWLTMLEEHLAIPFETRILGTMVSVERIDLDAAGQIVAICSRRHQRQALPILDLPLPCPPPAGSEWIEAYRRWRNLDAPVRY